jgi:hypothetical protein
MNQKPQLSLLLADPFHPSLIYTYACLVCICPVVLVQIKFDPWLEPANNFPLNLDLLLYQTLLEMAKDHFTDKREYELLAGYYSPVSDAYKKEGLAPASHRVKMCQLGVESTSNWLMVDSWESRQSTYQRTAVVLDHFNYELNTVGGGIKLRNGQYLSIDYDFIRAYSNPHLSASRRTS